MALGIAVTPTAFVVVATMTFGGVAHAPLDMMLMVGDMTGSDGLLAPAMVTIGVASVVVAASPAWSSATGPSIRASRARAPTRRCSS